jgi:hypothetical protein
MFRNIPFVAVYLAVRSGKRSCGQRRKERSTKLPIGGLAPARTSPLEKHTFFTKVGDQTCGVGYYKGRREIRYRAGRVSPKPLCLPWR